MKKLFLFISIILCHSLFAQQEKDSLSVSGVDSLDTENLAEVVIIASPDSDHLDENKVLGSLEDNLEESTSVNMVRRGAYAWEPMLNGMSVERSLITLDGMRIFQACTDKMDPITSYVENTNLSKAVISNGQAGAEFGGTIAGSIDLERKSSGFKEKKNLAGSAFAGFESNNLQQIYGTALNYSSPRFFTDLDFSFRNAENYRAGHQSGQSSEIDFSQFTKYNISAITGFKINGHQEIEVSVIFDKATDVGYPGLPMDVSLAQAVIASLQFRHRHLSENIPLWETKVYFNTVEHVMDDSQRPDVPIRMHMPGWSKTQGFYTKIQGHYNQHFIKANLSGYRNNSLAEMTMFPNQPDEKNMFMLTWPDVNTSYVGLNIEDKIPLNPHASLVFQGGVGIHHNQIESELGLKGLRLFYPDLPDTKTRVLKSLSSKLSYHHGNFLYAFEMGYGERAPTVSEAYGFYLLNVNDNYDYIGNPYLKNEKSMHLNISTSFSKDKLSMDASVNYFHILDYIIGKPEIGIPPMNLTADGIKIYEQLSHASIFNAGFEMEYAPFSDWIFSADASYRYGQGANQTILPLIQPFHYNLKTRYEKESFFVEASVEGSTKNRNSPEFGETEKPAYAIANIAFSKNFSLTDKNLILKLGIENLFDLYYSTFADWFGIPRMGRNFYVNVVYKF